jgi:hypothetical protein
MTETRTCEQCGAVFAPRREHARFCSVACRVAWNREKLGDPAAEASALEWSITGMDEAAQRLCQITVRDRARAFTLVAEAVWWVTLVDATLVRYHPGAYDRMLAAQPPAQQQVIEQTLAGLRFVRNRIGREPGHLDFIQPGMTGRRGHHIAAWLWRPVPEPVLTPLSPRGRGWELTRYRAYQAQLAGHTIGETFQRAAAFLKLAATNTPTSPQTSAHPAR